MAGAPRGMQDVELVDAGDATGSRAAAGAWARREPRLRAVARRRRRVVALAAVIALVALTAGVVDARRQAQRAAALAEVPGVVASLDRPVVELWRSTDRPLGELYRVGGRLVGAMQSVGTTESVGAMESTGGVAGAGSGAGTGRVVDVVALDASSGRDAWRTTVGTGPADPRWTSCVAVGTPPAWLACVVVDTTTTTDQSALGTRTYPTAARLVVVHVATGDVVRSAPTAPTGVLATVTDDRDDIGGDLLLADVDEDGRARVTRSEPRTGAVRWSFTSPEAVPTDQFRQRTVRIEAGGDVVVVDGGPVWVLSAQDGSLVDSWTPDLTLEAGGQVQVLAGGALLARPAAAGGGWGTEVVDLASGGSATAPGYPLPVVPDDGSLAGTVLMLSVDGLDLLALDVGARRLRWSVPAASGGWPVVMDGRVVRAEGASLRARDGGTGAVVWSAALDAATQSPLMTDGRLALVSLPGADGGSELVAFALADGRRQWSVVLDDEVGLSSVDGLLLGWTGTELVAFGPSGDRG